MYTSWERVAEAVRTRRLELGLTQAAAAERGGLSLPTWGIVERAGQDLYKTLTLSGICRALGWTPDSIERILAGGEPLLNNHVDDRPASSLEISQMRATLTQVVEGMALLNERLTAVEEDRQQPRRRGARRPDAGNSQ